MQKNIEGLYLEKLYKEGLLYRGHSEMVDQAIANIVQLGTNQMIGVANPLSVTLPPIPEGEFNKRWLEFVKVAMDEFPNIHPYNLTAITTMRVADERRHESLFLCQLIEALAPSSESMCFLGHAYRKMRKYYRATHCYEQAYQRAIGYATQHELAADNPLMLDAVDYLGDKAECLIETNLPADALLALTHAFQIIKQAGERAQFKVDYLNEVKARALQKAGWEKPPVKRSKYA